MTWINVQIYLWCLMGIVVSVILPVLWTYVRARFPSPGSPETNAKNAAQAIAFWEVVRPYAALGAASALTALLLLAFLGDSLTDPKAAMLAGYAWDSTLQKLR